MKSKKFPQEVFLSPAPYFSLFDEASSVVWGMPETVVQAELANSVLSLSQTSIEIMRKTLADQVQPLTV